MYNTLYPLAPLEQINEQKKLSLTPSQYTRLEQVYNDYMIHRDLRIFDLLHKKCGLLKAGDEYAKLMVNEALQFVLHTPENSKFYRS